MSAEKQSIGKELRNAAPGLYRVIRRNGDVAPFNPDKITIAIRKAFLAVEGDNAAVSQRVHETAEQLSRAVCEALQRRKPDGGTFHIEDIQDQVELALMREEHHKVARSYVLYRESRAEHRDDDRRKTGARGTDPSISTVLPDGSITPLDRERLYEIVRVACQGLEDVDPIRIVNNASKQLHNNIAYRDIGQVLIMTARALIEQEPNYSHVAARLLLNQLRSEALSFLNDGTFSEANQDEMADQYASYFSRYLVRGTRLLRLDEELQNFDIDKLAAAIEPERDLQFTYLGLQTLYDRYFIHENEIRYELPQAFFMRVAMGLAINEENREERAIEFYKLVSSFDFMSSSPTLFNSGTVRPQLSSCYLTTVPDDLSGIFKSIHDNAMLSKFAGGLGNDWTRVRALGAHIKGTNGKSQGVIPFLKVANDTLVACNQGGKRRGSGCAYLETWHLDVEEFLELRKNTGEERRRTHDMNTANWIPDLFMERVTNETDWTLFSPEDVPDLHDLFGQDFRKRYEEYELKADRGEIKLFKRVPAIELWKKMLNMLFETGHPWITFKDRCNLRSPQQHVGVVHSSNLCTEITLNTCDDEIAVCNLGSVNLAQHIQNGAINRDKLSKTIRTAMRMLDNVIDYNYYSVDKAKKANLRHRPVGLGLMGFQDALYQLRIPYTSQEAISFADESQELISYLAIEASIELAEERGTYETYKGSLWSIGVLPIDSLRHMAAGEENSLQVNTDATLDWEPLRARLKKSGIRNSNCMAIAPTATISNICGVSQSIEPTYQNLFVKSNLSGEFTIANPYLVNELKSHDLWDEVMVNDLKYYDGSIQQIERVPDEVKTLYATAFEIDSRWLVEAAARRQKWIDQGQSLNLYMAEPSGNKLDLLYKLAWVRGLKTTYYLRTIAATQVEKHTDVDNDELMSNESATPKVCSILDPDCEACQ